MSEEELEKKNKRTALVYTTIIQVVLVAALFFIVAWRAPDPPLPEYGIVLNFGTDDEGSGDVQPETPVGNKGQQEEEPEESKPKVQEETPKVEEKETKPVESKPVEQQIVSKVESPVVVKEKKEDEVKPVEKPAEKPEEKKVEPKVEKKPVEEKPKVDPDAVYKPNARSLHQIVRPPTPKQEPPETMGMILVRRETKEILKAAWMLRHYMANQVEVLEDISKFGLEWDLNGLKIIVPDNARGGLWIL